MKSMLAMALVTCGLSTVALADNAPAPSDRLRCTVNLATFAYGRHYMSLQPIVVELPAKESSVTVVKHFSKVIFNSAWQGTPTKFALSPIDNPSEYVKTAVKSFEPIADKTVKIALSRWPQEKNRKPGLGVRMTVTDGGDFSKGLNDWWGSDLILIAKVDIEGSDYLVTLSCGALQN